MSKIRCFIGDHKIYEDFDHKIYEDFDHKILWRLCEDFVETVWRTLLIIRLLKIFFCSFI